MKALVVALVVSCGVAAAHADAPGDARRHYQRGLALFNEARFAAARAEFEAGYQLQPLPLFLFNAAQAARRADDAKGALALYRQFVTADPQSSLRAEAEAHIAELSAKLPPPAAVAEPPPVIAAPGPPAVATSPATVRAHARPDGATTALLTIGSAGAATGAVLLGIGGARLTNAQTSYDAFDDAHRATPLVISGAVVLAVGGALIIAGAVRYDLARRRK